MLTARLNNAAMQDPLSAGYVGPAFRLSFAQKVATVGLFLVLIDNLQLYFIRQVTSAYVPVNALAAVLIVFLFLKDPFRFSLSIWLSGLLALSILVFTYGFFTGDYVINAEYVSNPVQMTLGAINSVAMLLLGFYCFRWLPPSTLVKVALLAGLCHALVNVIAFSKIAPSVFPVLERLARMDNETFFVRNEVASDPNFQVIYFLPSLAILALPFSRVRTLLALFVTAVGAYSLAKLQSRSGILVLMGGLALIWIAPLRIKFLGRRKLLLLTCFISIIAFWKLDKIYYVAEGLIARFTSKSTQGTASFRWESFKFFYENFWKPEFIMPRGLGVFAKQFHGSLPHSNVTSMMLRGGIVGVVLWFAIYIVPLVRLSWRFFTKRIDFIGVVVLVTCASILAIQLSLDVASMKHLWIWSGASLGLLSKYQVQEVGQRRAAMLARSQGYYMPVGGV